MEWLGFLGSIIGGLIGGLFTYLGVKLTIKNDNQRKKEELNKKIYENRPRLEIVQYKEIKPFKVDNKADLKALLLSIQNVKILDDGIEFFYDEKAKNTNNLCYIEYKFKNTGFTEIDDLCLTTNMYRNTALLEFDIKDEFIDDRLLNYSVYSKKRFIKTGDTIIIRIYYLKEHIISGVISAQFDIYMRDINGKYWVQPLFAPTKEIENSVQISYKEYKNNSDIKMSLDCFRGKKFW